LEKNHSFFNKILFKSPWTSFSLNKKTIALLIFQELNVSLGCCLAIKIFPYFELFIVMYSILFPPIV